MPDELQPELFAPTPPAAVATATEKVAARPRWKKPRVSAAEVASMEARLRGYGWQKRSDLQVDERDLRLLAEAADGAILSYPGSPGYRHFDDASPGEWDQTDIAFTRQINAMIRRRNVYRRRRQRVERGRLRPV